ncbi:hypothetical protein [Thermoanaerobacterium sp. PSU-2]|uniref:hypothetical protein n=1 Tax=Thermoanaerobacterium sp. PSU-2 TaxID=1930849 RepID=UPI00143878C8|nr:hypothetical protein [Thermoanaerobacterium sp. PSU-2]
MIIANMTWNVERKGGANMSVRLAQILYKLFHITTTVKNGRVKHGIEFFNT